MIHGLLLGAGALGLAGLLTWQERRDQRSIAAVEEDCDSTTALMEYVLDGHPLDSRDPEINRLFQWRREAYTELLETHPSFRGDEATRHLQWLELYCDPPAMPTPKFI